MRLLASCVRLRSLGDEALSPAREAFSFNDAAKSLGVEAPSLDIGALRPTVEAQSPIGGAWSFKRPPAGVVALGQIVAQSFGPLPLQLASLVVLVPWVAACTRRLRDAGFSPWWQLISLAPVAGIVVLLYLLTFPAKAEVGV